MASLTWKRDGKVHHFDTTFFEDQWYSLITQDVVEWAAEVAATRREPEKVFRFIVGDFVNGEPSKLRDFSAWQAARTRRAQAKAAAIAKQSVQVVEPKPAGPEMTREERRALMESFRRAPSTAKIGGAA